MFFKRLAIVGLLGGLAFGTAACTDGYGYSGVGVGYGSAGYYGDPYYDGFGYAGYAGYPGGYGGYGGLGGYYGWYGDYYYPGSGVYVSHDCHPRRWPSLLLRWPGSQRRIDLGGCAAGA